MKQQIYHVKPESFWGDDKEQKRQEQLTLVESLGLKEFEYPHHGVYCNADQVISLLLGGYVSKYGATTDITPIIQTDVTDLDTVKELMSTAINGVREATEALFNSKCGQQQPGNDLMTIDSTMLLEDSCTDILQDYLNKGWRIIAVCPQPDSRRPDYILGRSGKIQEGALRG